MKTKSKSVGTQPFVVVDSEVVRRIRQQARSSSATEICGVLIGQDRDLRIEVKECIEGENADQAGAHVTFTQDTWEHIYAVKDKKFPNERIVGWYHSHPGFGVFLSEHDTFIHKNFFSSPGQVAWVFDPHSDEEGCFGWVSGRIERLSRIAVSDRRGGEMAAMGGEQDPARGTTSRPDRETQPKADNNSNPMPLLRVETESAVGERSNTLEQLVAKVFLSLALLALGGMLSWYLFPRIVVMPVLVDPAGRLVDAQTGQVVGQLRPESGGSGDRGAPSKTGQGAGSQDLKKGDDAKSK